MTSAGRERFRSFSLAARDFGLSGDPALTYFGDFQSASGSAGAHHLLALPQLPTALLAAYSPMAVGALATPNRKGLRIGQDMALIAFDDIEWFSLLDPPLTVISHDVEAMGRRSAAPRSHRRNQTRIRSSSQRTDYSGILGQR